jgi:hypothetical protein
LAEKTGYGAAQLSVKFGAGHLLNVCGDSVEELVERVGKLADLKQLIITAAEEILAAAVITNTFQGTTQVPQAPPQDAGPPAWQNAPPAPAYGVKLCAHGMPYTAKSGTNAQGKAWSGQFCQFPDKNQQCAPIWSGR